MISRVGQACVEYDGAKTLFQARQTELSHGQEGSLPHAEALLAIYIPQLVSHVSNVLDLDKREACQFLNRLMASSQPIRTQTGW